MQVLAFQQLPDVGPDLVQVILHRVEPVSYTHLPVQNPTLDIILLLLNQSLYDFLNH